MAAAIVLGWLAFWLAVGLTLTWGVWVLRVCMTLFGFDLRMSRHRICLKLLQTVIATEVKGLAVALKLLVGVGTDFHAANGIDRHAASQSRVYGFRHPIIRSVLNPQPQTA